MSNHALSPRGHHLTLSPARIDIDLFMEAVENLYDPVSNPEGAFPLNVAENFIMTDTIRTELNRIVAATEIPAWVLQYTSPLGSPEVRESVAAFMRRYFDSHSIQPENIVFSAGAAASLEIASFALASSNDVVVIPAPAYPMYSKDLGVKSGVERYDLQTHFDINGHASLALVTTDLLDKALTDIKALGKHFKILLITSPDNPTGSKYTELQLRKLANWCMDHQIHLIVNEIYALSEIDVENDTLKDDYDQSVNYTSFAQIMDQEKSDHLHLLYALSKDFAMSGMRFGIIHSHNKTLINALESVNIPHMVSNVTQWMVGEMFKHSEFIDAYIKENKKRVTQSYKVVTETLKHLNLPYSSARGSLFVWADFSRYLSANTAEAELTLWNDIYQKTSVLLTPGTGFGHQKKGMFRIVHTAVPTDHLKVAMGRVLNYKR